MFGVEEADAPHGDALARRLAALDAFGTGVAAAHGGAPPRAASTGAPASPDRAPGAGAGPLPAARAGSLGALADVLGGALVPPPPRLGGATTPAPALADLWAAGDGAARAPPLAGLDLDLAGLARRPPPPPPPPRAPQAFQPPTPADVRALVERLPLEADAGAALAAALPQRALAALDPASFGDVLTSLAAAGHAFRAWQLFDWARGAPPGAPGAHLAAAPAYAAMVDACGGWQQLRQALDLVAEMRSRGLADGGGAAAALLRAALRAGDAALACEAYSALAATPSPRPPASCRALIDVAARAGAVGVALAALDDLRVAAAAPGLARAPPGARDPAPRPPPPPPPPGAPPIPLDAPAYNVVLVAASRADDAGRALAVYARMAADGVPPNTKTFTALLAAAGAGDAGLDAIAGCVPDAGADPAGARAAYGAALAACEKAGHWHAASGLFDRAAAAGVPPDVASFNSVIAACAHGGEAGRARAAFDAMAAARVARDAVSHANLIRAYKKAGAWAAALTTYEAMLDAGCVAHASVVASVVDVLWSTGVAWARAKAAAVHDAALASGRLPLPLETARKGALRVDLAALTPAAAVLGAAAWLRAARGAAARGAGSPLDAARKVTLSHGGGEAARAQGHAASLRDAVAASLAGGGAPFRPAPDHARSGRLDAPAPALRRWLFSPAFDAYSAAAGGGGSGGASALGATADLVAADARAAAAASHAHADLAAIEARHAPALASLAAAAPVYAQQRGALVAAAAHQAAALRLPPPALHAAVALMDRVMAAGVRTTGQFHALFVAACLRVAARGRARGPEPALADAAAGAGYPEAALARMEANVEACLGGDVDAAPAADWLALFARRLGADPASPASRRAAAGAAFGAAGDALADVVLAQHPPSLVAAGLLAAGRRGVGAVPAWPTTLAALTGYTEAGTPSFAAVEALAGRFVAHAAATGAE